MIHFFVVSVALLFAAPALAQSLDLPAPSPGAEATQHIGVVKATINYSSPGKKDRKIWGGLVPYGELWRTGANSATTLELTGDVKIGGKDVPAGKYAIFTIPGKETWTVIINSNPDQGGTRNYDKKLDVARIQVKPVKAEARERMTFLFTDTTDSSSRLDLVWDRLRVSLPITIDTPKLAASNVKTYVAEAARGLANAARYYAKENQVQEAFRLIDASISADETWFNVWLKAELLADKGDYKAAYPLTEKAYAMGKKADYFFWKDKVEKALKVWKGK